MKTFSGILLFFISFSVIGQNKESGVYLTYQDYLNHKLSYQSSNANTIKINSVLSSSFIVVKSNGTNIKLKKDSIYGVANGTDKLIRFCENKPYYLIEKGAIWIFAKEEILHQGKAKLTVTEKKYCFSTNGADKLSPLTVDDVKVVFINNQKLQNLLQVEFKCDKDLVVYDSHKNEFKIEEAIESSIK